MSENPQVIQSDEKSQVQLDEVKQEVSEVDNSWTSQQLAEKLKLVNAEARDNRKRAVEEKRKREELEKKVLVESGQFKELAEVWQRKAIDAEARELKVKEAFAITAISNTVLNEANRLGCVDGRALLQHINLNDLPLDDNFNVDPQHVRVVLEEVKKKQPYFFNTPKPKFIDAIPGRVEASQGKPLDKMTSQEIQQLLLEKYKK